MFLSSQASFRGALVLLIGVLNCQPTLAESAKKEKKTASAFHKESCYTRQELAARGGGFLVRVISGEGDTVKKGELIAELDSRVIRAAKKEAEAGVAAAQAMLALANDGWARLKQLAKTDTVAPQELFSAEIQVQKAKAQLMQAEAVLERAKATLDDTRIVAELDGKVSGLPHVKGLYIQPGQSLGHVEASSSACNP